MNRIVKESYPVADLPEDLRTDLSGIERVRLVIEPAVQTPNENIPTLDELFAMRRPPYRTTEEIVAEIRRDRDSWDD